MTVLDERQPDQAAPAPAGPAADVPRPSSGVAAVVAAVAIAATIAVVAAYLLRGATSSVESFDYRATSPMNSTSERIEVDGGDLVVRFAGEAIDAGSASHIAIALLDEDGRTVDRFDAPYKFSGERVFDVEAGTYRIHLTATNAAGTVDIRQ